MIIKTNNRPRPTLTWGELTDKERVELDYFDGDSFDGSFVRYRGSVYDLCDMPRAPKDMAPWDGALSDSYFSAVLCRYVDGTGETVIMGLALS